jgi:hypothetical protein
MRALPFIFAIAAVVSAHAQTPEPAAGLLKKAQAQAAREGKAVFVVFDASW